MNTFSPETKEKMFKCLDDLQVSGVVNMYGGSASYVRSRFLLTPQESKAVVLEWMSTYDTRHKGENNK